jgi:hypothetical protein
VPAVERREAWELWNGGGWLALLGAQWCSHVEAEKCSSCCCTGAAMRPFRRTRAASPDSVVSRGGVGTALDFNSRRASALARPLRLGPPRPAALRPCAVAPLPPQRRRPAIRLCCRPRRPNAPGSSPGAPTLQCLAAQQPAGEIPARLLRDIPTRVKVLDQRHHQQHPREDSTQLQRMAAKGRGKKKEPGGKLSFPTCSLTS